MLVPLAAAHVRSIRVLDNGATLSATGNRPLAATGESAAARSPRPASASGTELRRDTRAEDTTAATATALRQPSPRARLTYDPQEATVYIEILNPRTGAVIQRLPPEQATDAVLRATERTIGAVVDARA